MVVSAWPAFWLYAATIALFSEHIAYVVSVSAKEEMRRICAITTITSMAYTNPVVAAIMRYRAISQRPCDTVGKKILATYTHTAITVFYCVGCPDPARAFHVRHRWAVFVHFRPKTRLLRWSELDFAACW